MKEELLDETHKQIKATHHHLELLCVRRTILSITTTQDIDHDILTVNSSCKLYPHRDAPLGQPAIK
jgi:hypothetical protein